MLDKDDFLEALFESDGPIDTSERAALSRRADEQFIDAARRLPSGVLVSFWRRDERSEKSGTPTAWLHDRGSVVEVWCDCEPGVAASRFLTRRRHPAHGDGRHTELPEIIGRFAQLAAYGSLGIGELVRVDTNSQVDNDDLARRVRRASASVAGETDHDEIGR